jgi:hypothetical protein
MEGKRKAVGEIILYHPRLFVLALCYVITSFVLMFSLKKGTVRPWATRNVFITSGKATRCGVPVVAIAIPIPFLIFYAGNLVLP